MSLLVNQSEIAPGRPLFASASGGGGGGGPTQSINSITNLSSILFNVAGGDGNTPYALNIYGQGNPSQVVFNNGGISAPAAASIYTGMWASTLVNALSGSFAGDFLVTQDPGFVNSQLVVGSILNDGNVIASTDQNRNTAPLNILANPLAVSSLVVSSINGAVPGGGGATVSTFSDLTVSNPTALGATLNLRASDTNLYEIDCVSSSVVLAGVSIGYVGGRDQVYIDTGEVPNFYTSTIKGATGQISLNPTGTEQIRIGGVGAPGDITVATVGGGNINLTGPVVQSSGTASFSGAASISSLTVSSINGATPGGGSVITRTSVNTWSSGDIPGDGTNTAITPGFTTLAGHLYTLQGFLYANASANITSNASLALQIGNIDRAYQAAIPLWGYSAGTAGLVFGNNIPVSMTWRANTGAVNNAVYGQMLDAGGAATSTSITAQSALTLFDLGPVA